MGFIESWEIYSARGEANNGSWSMALSHSASLSNSFPGQVGLEVRITCASLSFRHISDSNLEEISSRFYLSLSKTSSFKRSEAMLGSTEPEPPLLCPHSRLQEVTAMGSFPFLHNNIRPHSHSTSLPKIFDNHFSISFQHV
jgi:hypothetical protein